MVNTISENESMNESMDMSYQRMLRRFEAYAPYFTTIQNASSYVHPSVSGIADCIPQKAYGETEKAALWAKTLQFGPGIAVTKNGDNVPTSV